jgi:hypothetical protein
MSPTHLTSEERRRSRVASILMFADVEVSFQLASQFLSI